MLLRRIGRKDKMSVHYMEEYRGMYKHPWELGLIIIKVSRFSRLVNVLRDLKLVTHILCVILEHAWEN